MKNGKVIMGIVAAILIIGGIVLLIKLISGAFGLLGGFLNTVLGIALIIALIAIVAWMFWYAKKH